MSEMKIQVKYTPTEWVKGVEGWQCQHPDQQPDTIVSDFMTLNGAEQTETPISECRDCKAWRYQTDDSFQEVWHD